jgi:hypothetical protein
VYSVAAGLCLRNIWELEVEVFGLAALGEVIGASTDCTRSLRVRDVSNGTYPYVLHVCGMSFGLAPLGDDCSVLSSDSHRRGRDAAKLHVLEGAQERSLCLLRCAAR